MKQVSAKVKIFVACCVLLQAACSPKIQQTVVSPEPPPAPEIPVEPPPPPPPVVPVQPPPAPAPMATAAERLDIYLPMLKDKTVALMVNQTSMVDTVHLVDSLLRLGVKIKMIFAPEHGFRGSADAGEKVPDGKDQRTGVTLTSLYGSKKKPSAADLAGVDWVIFDIQDVGARFYTYIYSMFYLMQACAEHKVPLMVLDRPNPNGHYVDGPMMRDGYQSFIGLHYIPVVHGMTVGEYAQLVNGEGWLGDGLRCNLAVIPCKNYDHKTPYALPVKPSPNLPNMNAIYLYPSICFFEGTNVSLGRGTNKQFQVYGSPGFPKGDYEFTPVPMPGAKTPPLQGQLCRGYDLSGVSADSLRAEARINLSYVLDFYKSFPNKDKFFLENLFFDKLAGSDQLRKQIIAGKTEAEIRASWQADLAAFKVIRKKYLLYPDFE